MKSRSRFSGAAGVEYELFKLACQHYDELQQNIAGAVKKYLKTNFLNKKEIRILDIGCGPGYTTAFILDALPNDGRIKVIALDNEEKMATQAQQVLGNYIFQGRVEIKHCDVSNFLPITSFHFIISGFTFHNWKSDFRNKTLSQVYNSLALGGLFVNGDKFANNNAAQHYMDLKWQIDQFFSTYSKIGRYDLFQTWALHYLEDNQPNVIMTEGKSIKEMTDIGFIDIRKIFRKHMEAIYIAKK